MLQIDSASLRSPVRSPVPIIARPGCTSRTNHCHKGRTSGLDGGSEGCTQGIPARIPRWSGRRRHTLSALPESVDGRDVIWSPRLALVTERVQPEHHVAGSAANRFARRLGSGPDSVAAQFLFHGRFGLRTRGGCLHDHNTLSSDDTSQKRSGTVPPDPQCTRLSCTRKGWGSRPCASSSAWR
jgi:hypothetical protein